jgi:S1-C subfamily serine protease
MPSFRTARQFFALVAAAVLGGAAAVGAVALLGGLEGDTTVVTETAAAPPASSPPTGAQGMSINEIYERAAPGVVRISVPEEQALGSGFVIDRAGHIVTNYHVVRAADEVTVSFSNRDRVKAEVIGTDPSTDLAVLRVETSANALTPLPLGNSDGVKVGDPVVAIGNPFGLDRTATAGIVSALQRLITGPTGFTIDHVIQTDAPINRGNSGGPLLNLDGQVIGVNTQIETGDVSTGNVGIGFAVPSNTVKDVVAQILRTGRVEHAYLGILGRAITSDVADIFRLPVDEGVLIEDVKDDTAAAKARLREGDTQVVVAGETYVLGGDIIVSLDGKPITTVEELREAISAHEPGDEVTLGIYRGDKKLSVRVTLGRQPLSPQG